MHDYSKPLSATAWELLTLVGEKTTWEGNERPGRDLTGFFVPRYEPVFCVTLNKMIRVSGSGHASAFKALERKGLIRNERNVADYAYSITEDGLLALTAQEYTVGASR